MRFIFAPDSFKGSVSASRIAQILEEAAKARFPDARYTSLPVADGGEGTMEALLRIFGGETVPVNVTGPTGETVSAEYARLTDGRAVIEMAKSSGLPLVAPELRDPLKLTSRGLGELIKSALDAGCEDILIGLGGSATNDGGMGALSALGAVFIDERGRELKGAGADLARVKRVDLSRTHAKLKRARLTIISDVNNPLLGENGATRVYGPQKGADEIALDALESGMRNYARAFEAMGMDIASFPGAGAAGGCGAALCGVLGAEMRRGIDAVLDMAGFDELLPGCDLVVTGEGRVDGQTAKYGKVPAGVLMRCKRHNVRCAVLAGGMGPEAEQLYELGDAMIFPIVNAPMTLKSAMDKGEELVRQTADRLFWAFGAGYARG